MLQIRYTTYTRFIYINEIAVVVVVVFVFPLILYEVFVAPCCGALHLRGSTNLSAVVFRRTCKKQSAKSNMQSCPPSHPFEN